MTPPFPDSAGGAGFSWFEVELVSEYVALDVRAGVIPTSGAVAVALRSGEVDTDLAGITIHKLVARDGIVWLDLVDGVMHATTRAGKLRAFVINGAVRSQARGGVLRDPYIHSGAPQPRTRAGFARIRGGGEVQQSLHGGRQRGLVRAGALRQRSANGTVRKRMTGGVVRAFALSGNVVDRPTGGIAK